MLNASSRLPLTSPAVQHAVNGDPKLLWISPQHGSFKNSNNAQYFASFHVLAPRQIAIIDQKKGARVWPKTVDDQFDCQLTEGLFGTHNLRSSVLTEHYNVTFSSFADIGSVTSVTANNDWLAEALNELAACPAYAADEGLDEPSRLGLAKAKKLLQEVSTYVEDRPDIYPMDEGSIAIDFRNVGNRNGVLFLIEQNGSGALFHRTQKSKGRLRVDDAADLLSEGGMLELKRVGIR